MARKPRTPAQVEAQRVRNAARDHKAIYQRRVDRAKAAGFTGLKAHQTAKKAVGPKVTAAQYQAHKDRKAAASRARRQIHQTAAGTTVSTTAGGAGYGLIEDRLRKHGDRPVRIIIETTAGKRREVYGRGRAARDVNLGSAAGAAAIANGSTAYNEDLDAGDIAGVYVELLDGWPA